MPSKVPKYAWEESQKERRDKSQKKISRKNSIKFPKFDERHSSNIQESQQIPSRIISKKSTPRHVERKLSKEKVLKIERWNPFIMYKGSSIRLTANFSSETTEARRQCDGIFKVPKENYCQPKILYPAKVFLKNEGEIKTFPDKQKLWEFIASKTTLEEILNRVFLAEMKRPLDSSSYLMRK